VFPASLLGHFFTDDSGQRIIFLTCRQDEEIPDWNRLSTATVKAVIPGGPLGGVRYRITEIRPIEGRPYAQLTLRPADRWYARMDDRYVRGVIGQINVEEFRFDLQDQNFALRRAENGVYRYAE